MLSIHNERQLKKTERKNGALRIQEKKTLLSIDETPGALTVPWGIDGAVGHSVGGRIVSGATRRPPPCAYTRSIRGVMRIHLPIAAIVPVGQGRTRIAASLASTVAGDSSEPGMPRGGPGGAQSSVSGPVWSSSARALTPVTILARSWARPPNYAPTL